MRSSLVRLGIVLLGVACDAVPAQETCKRVRTFAVDPVELLSGRKSKGDESLLVVRGMYNYHFVSAATKAAFEADPDKYEVQLGGACARMGPLSGYGRGDIYAVHDGRIYLFASQQCRESFLKAPQSLLERDDEPFAVDEGKRRRGLELIELAVKHAGGPRIDALRSLRQRVTQTEKHGDKEYRVGETLTLAFPDSIRHEDSWDDWTGGQVVVGARGWGVDSKSTEDMPLAAAQVRAVKRIANRHPLAILRARRRPDFLVAALGAGPAGAAVGERVEVYYDGCRMVLTVDPASGRLLALQARMRGPTMAMADALVIFTEERTVEGVTLPCGSVTEYDGTKPETAPATTTTIEVDPQLDPKLFEPPAPG